jgi:hypothetical protein
MTDQFIHAPWTDKQVAALNASQEAYTRHPFTCGRRDLPGHKWDKGDLGVLTATTNGWVCESCGYTQDWAWAFMLEEGGGFDPAFFKQSR